MPVLVSPPTPRVLTSPGEDDEGGFQVPLQPAVAIDEVGHVLCLGQRSCLDSQGLGGGTAGTGGRVSPELGVGGGWDAGMGGLPLLPTSGKLSDHLPALPVSPASSFPASQDNPTKTPSPKAPQGRDGPPPTPPGGGTPRAAWTCSSLGEQSPLGRGWRQKLSWWK